jgi:two-component system response regulator
MPSELTRWVLVVDDDQIDTEYILCKLDELGVPYEVAARSFEAIALLRRKDAVRPALVLLDWKISGGGASVLRAVREDPVLAATPVVVLSRSTARDDVRAALSLYANAFVAKAPELRDFQDHVGVICELFLNIAQPPPMPDTE